MSRTMKILSLVIIALFLGSILEIAALTLFVHTSPYTFFLSQIIITALLVISFGTIYKRLSILPPLQLIPRRRTNPWFEI